MFARRKGAKRFSLLLLEDEEDYVADWVASAVWPDGVEGNWSGAQQLPGRLRLATRSLFFEPDDVRVPIVRWVPFVEEGGGRSGSCLAAFYGGSILQPWPLQRPLATTSA